MKFLNYKSVENWSQISELSVRPTDGFNQENATFYVRAHGSSLPNKNIRVLVRIIPTYISPEFYITYDTGKQRFERLLFTSKSRLVSKIQLKFEQVLNDSLQSSDEFRLLSTSSESEFLEGDTEHRSGTYSGVRDHSRTGSTNKKTDPDEFQKKPFENECKNLVIFEKIFSEIPSGTTMKVTSRGFNPQKYTEPVIGSAFPLWHIGGRLDNDITKVESVFIFPQINRKFPTSAEIVLIGLSDVTEPTFPNGSRFACVPSNPPPWNLTKCIEKGEILLRLANNHLKSSHVESSTMETAIIVFNEQ